MSGKGRYSGYSGLDLSGFSDIPDGIWQVFRIFRTAWNFFWIFRIFLKSSGVMTMDVNFLSSDVISDTRASSYTLLKFWQYNKASLGELAPLEILGKFTRFNLGSLAEISPIVYTVSTVYWTMRYSFYLLDSSYEVCKDLTKCWSSKNYLVVYRKSFGRVYITNAWLVKAWINDLYCSLLKQKLLVFSVQKVAPSGRGLNGVTTTKINCYWYMRHPLQRYIIVM